MTASGRLLVIGASDPAGRAGVQADIRAVNALGGIAQAAVSAVPGPVRQGAASLLPVERTLFRRQLRAAMGGSGTDAIKTGLLPSVAAIDAVADLLEELGPEPPLVVAAAVVDGKGQPMIDGTALAHLKRRLLCRASVLVAGIAAAEALAGMTIAGIEDKRRAADMLRTVGPETVVLTDEGGPNGTAVDYIAWDSGDDDELVLDYPRPAGPSASALDGVLATAIAIGLAQGLRMFAAVRRARNYLAEAARSIPSAGPPP